MVSPEFPSWIPWSFIFISQFNISYPLSTFKILVWLIYRKMQFKIFTHIYIYIHTHTHIYIYIRIYIYIYYAHMEGRLFRAFFWVYVLFLISLSSTVPLFRFLFFLLFCFSFFAFLPFCIHSCFSVFASTILCLLLCLFCFSGILLRCFSCFFSLFFVYALYLFCFRCFLKSKVPATANGSENGLSQKWKKLN